jgi:hypothetical protein
MLALCIASVLSAGSPGNAQNPLHSGPPPKARIGPFHPLFVSGEKAGWRVELVPYLWFAKEPPLPAVIIFARGMNVATVQLMKSLDAQAAESKRFRVAVVFLSDDKEFPNKVKALLTKAKIQGAIVTVHASEGPSSWKIAKEAEITVILLRRTVVLGNFAFRPGELGEAATVRIVEEAKKLK